MKRTPLGRGKPLARGKPLERGSGGLARGKRLAPRSENRAAARDDERDATMATFVRDRHHCLLEGREGWGRCIAPLTPHHLSGGASHRAIAYAFHERLSSWRRTSTDCGDVLQQ